MLLRTFFCACQGSRATRKKCAKRRTPGLVLSLVSLEGSTYFLWKRCVVFQQMKNNFYLPCQFFENRRSMLMLLFLPYNRSDGTFYSQTKIVKNCYAFYYYHGYLSILALLSIEIIDSLGCLSCRQYFLRSHFTPHNLDI